MRNSIEDLKVSIKTVWPVLVALVGITVYGIRRFDIIENKLNHLNDYNWTLFDQMEWAAQVRSHYTNVPDPNTIFRLNRGLLKPTTAVVVATNMFTAKNK